MQDHETVAIIGAGGIGFDVAEYLVHDDRHNFYETWGIDTELEQRGGLNAAEDDVEANRPYAPAIVEEDGEVDWVKPPAGSTAWA